MKSPEANQNENYENQDELWRLTLGLNSREGIELSRDKQGKPLLKLSENVHYPKPEEFHSKSHITGEIFLNPVDQDHPDTYVIPDNSTTLVNILNEASGTTDSFYMTPTESRTIGILSGILGEVSTGLQRLAEEEKVLPTELAYDRVLVVKDVFGFKLLPPVDLVHVDTKTELKKAWGNISESFMTSLAEGATTPTQWSLIDALKEPTKEAFHWQNISN